MQPEVMGQTVAVWVVETPLTLLASYPTHFHTFTSALCHLILYVCICTGLPHVLQRKVKAKKKQCMSVVLRYLSLHICL